MYNTSRDVTAPSLARPPPPSSPALSAPGEVSPCRSPSPSVSACAAGCRASPSPHARSEGADKEQERLRDLSFGVSEQLDYKTPLFLFFYLFFYFFIFTTSGLEKQPAIMSRGPEDASRLTESTYKVSEDTHTHTHTASKGITERGSSLS